MVEVNDDALGCFMKIASSRQWHKYIQVICFQAILIVFENIIFTRFLSTTMNQSKVLILFIGWLVWFPLESIFHGLDLSNQVDHQNNNLTELNSYQKYVLNF